MWFFAKKEAGAVNIFKISFGWIIILFLGFAIFYPSGKAFSFDYGTLVEALQKEDWHAHFSTHSEREKLSRYFDMLVALTKNKGLDWRIRIRGIILVSETDSAKRADVLIGMYHNPFFNAGCPSIKQSIVIALGNIAYDPGVIDTIIEATNDSEIEVREAAILALGRAGDEKAVPFLIDKLDDRSFAIKRSAILALGLIKDKRAVPFLSKMARRDSDDLLRMEAMAALTKMTS